MKRMHTPQPYRAGHHERASIAIRLMRWLRRVKRPLHLRWIAMQERNAEDHISDLVSMHEAIPKNIVRMHRVTVQLAEQRMRIERGI